MYWKNKILNDMFRSSGITFWLGGNECWMNPADSGGLYGGVGFLPWMCGHMKDAEHALSWCRRMLASGRPLSVLPW